LGAAVHTNNGDLRNTGKRGNKNKYGTKWGVGALKKTCNECYNISHDVEQNISRTGFTKAVIDVKAEAVCPGVLPQSSVTL
jgi:hypothetical protein